MAAPRQHSHGSRSASGSRPRRQQLQYEPIPESSPWKKLLWAAGAAGVVIAAMMADDAWALRDSLRRLAHGEEIPAYRASEWKDAQGVRESLADSLLTSELTPSVEDRDTQRNLALHALVAAAGDETISKGGGRMGALMQELCLDVEWLEEIVYYCPMELAEKALPILAHIYGAERRKMEGMPGNRRLATALAFEFARAGLDKLQAQNAFLFYAASGQKHWLNNRFGEMALWEMRVIASRYTDAEWSREETLTWFQHNTRLPASGYVRLGNSLGSRESSLFGVTADSEALLALYRDSSEGGIASMYEAADCSTPLARAQYAATAACANGVPALVVSGPSGAACMVDVNGSWEASAPMEGEMSSSWSFCGQNHPDFARLASLLWSDKDKSFASARLAQMGQYLYGTGNRPLSQTFFREALKACPQNYAAWVAYHACGAPQAEIAEAAKHFENLPGVAAALTALAAQQEP